MVNTISVLTFLVVAASSARSAVLYRATYDSAAAADNSLVERKDKQFGTNNCGTVSSQTSNCQNAYMNGIDDFCVYAPPNKGKTGKGQTIGDSERYEVSYCMKPGYGTRVFPKGTIKGARWVKTPDFVQVTGFGDFTKINVAPNDAGGELDPHGADGQGNPIGAKVYGKSFSSDGKTLQEYHEWTNFMSATEFCFRACKDTPGSNKAKLLCNHIYDVMGCQWNMPAAYPHITFDSCLGESGQPMGIYTKGKNPVTTSTWHQGIKPTPAAHPRPAVSKCVTVANPN